MESPKQEEPLAPAESLNSAHESPKQEETPALVESPRSAQQQHEERPILSAMAVKTEPIELSLIPYQEPKQQQFIKSIDELAALSAAIYNFKRQYDELQKHVEFIQGAIHSRLNGTTSSVQPLVQNNAQLAIDSTEAGKQPPQLIGPSETEAAKKSEPQRLCETMCGRGLRRYIASNLSNAAKLCEEIPAALKLAKNPAGLILDCIGKFYLQGSKAYAVDSPMITSRKACVLALEYFLLMSGDCSEGDIEIESSAKAEAENGAIAWKKRLMVEGGLRKADTMDSRGLLLLVAGFGIPPGFKHDDLVELIRLSNPTEITIALRRSSVLSLRIPGIIESLMKRGMHIEAVDLAYTFGLEDRFPPQTILTSFLKMNKETFEREKRKAHSPMALKEANEKQVAALKSLVKCLETRKIDPAKFLTGWQIEEQIIKLEENIAKLRKEIEETARTRRRMAEIASPAELYNQETKRPRFTPTRPALPASSYPHMYQNQRFSTYVGQNDISQLVNNYLAPSSSMTNGSGSKSLRQGGVPAYAAGSTLPPGSYSAYSGVHGQSFSAQQTSYGLHSFYGQSQSTEGFTGLPNPSSASNPTSDLYGFADAI